MNRQQSYNSRSSNQVASAAPYSTHSSHTEKMTQYSQYGQATSMPASANSYSHGYNYYGGVTSPQSATHASSTSMNSQLAPLPLIGMNHSTSGSYPPSATSQGAYSPDLQRHQLSQPQSQPPPPPSQQAQSQQQQQQQHFDLSGQVPPPGGVKPRVTATLWEDEGSLCFQVEAKGVCVARREDNHFINGTKLLNVAGMTRGRRDGILKSEKVRHVVKIGPMHLKGVWIPYERALDFANREKITELLYPLFVHNISALLYHPTNPTRPATSVDSARRKDGQRPLPPSLGVSAGPASAGLHHHHSLNGQMSAQSPIASHQSSNRPEISRAHTFPTPPTSASAIIPPQPNSYDWSNQSMPSNVSNSQPLTIETGIHPTRSMPSTPATTPPANSLQSMPSYSNNGSYGSNYANTPHTPTTFATQQHNLARFGQPLTSHGYGKSEMGPPSRGNATADADQGTDALDHGAGDEGDHEGEYHRYAPSQAPFNYTPTSAMGSMPGDQAHLAHDQEGSPHGGSGRVTPRNSVGHAAWSSGYNTPPRTASSVNLNYGMGDSRNSLANGHSVNDAYGVAGYNLGSAKRGREDDDDYKSHADSIDLKRRKSNREESLSGAPVGGYDYQRARSTIIQSASR